MSKITEWGAKLGDSMGRITPRTPERKQKVEGM